MHPTNTHSLIDSARGDRHARRGNAIVLVSAILVLLVIVATAFVTRSQTSRATAEATRLSEQRDDVVEVIAHSVAREIASNLFTQPIDPTIPAGPPVFFRGPDAAPHSNVARLDPSIWNPVRGGVDRDAFNNQQLIGGVFVNNPDGLPDFPFNFAPHHTVPFTNWPDASTRNPNNPLLPLVSNFNLLPRGPGNPTASAITDPTSPLAGEGNPVGNPGMGDNRYLRDLEPLRVDTNNSGVQDAFLQWRHLSNLARINNGYRVIRDISDVTNVLGLKPDGSIGGVVDDLNLPIEQWLSIPPATYVPAVGYNGIFDPNVFFNQWRAWFGVDNGVDQYLSVYANNSGPGITFPANFYRLTDLNASGTTHDWFIGGVPQDRPESEFIPGTARHTVSRVLTDTDGDGFTDSFWFLAPTPIVDGVRHIVAVSVIDNSAKINANVATKFQQVDPNFKTLGILPTDLALFGDLPNAGGSAALRVGFYDNPAHQLVGSYNLTRFLDHRRHVGLSGTGAYDNISQSERFNFWRRAALNPLSSETQTGSGALGLDTAYRPFSLSDEIELRMHFGNNHRWIYSAYEQSVQQENAGAEFLRSARNEANEFVSQLNSRDLMLDNRHRITLYSATRNDLLPAWLWYRFAVGVNPVYPLPFVAQYNSAPSPNAQATALRNFTQQWRRKVDLREVRPGRLEFPNFAAFDGGLLTLRERLPYALFLAMTDGDSPFQSGGYYSSDPTSSNLEEAKLAAGLAANILESRDDDLEAFLANAVPVPNFVPLGAPVSVPDTRYLGMEPQPFIAEAFIGHVYSAIRVSDIYAVPTTYDNETEFVIHESSDRRSSIVVVQLANPFDTPINLEAYRLNIFGEPVRLSGILGPSVDGNPVVAVFFAIKDDIINQPNLKDEWVDFLDINLADLPAGSLVVDVSPFVDVDRRTLYDTSSAEAIELLRADFSLSGSDYVVVDRIDDEALENGERTFGDEVNRMGNSPLAALPPSGDPPFNGGIGQYDLPGIARLGTAYNAWVQWVRVTRAWGVDVDGDGEYSENERNPRYVFADRAVVTSAEHQNPTVSKLDDDDKFRDKNDDPLVYGAAYNPADDNPDDPWFGRAYQVLDGTERFSKPTFFNLLPSDDTSVMPANPPYLVAMPGFVRPMPDKGWYGQIGSGGSNVGSADDSARPSAAPKGWFRHDFAMQMRQKNPTMPGTGSDFLQLGEVLNMWLKGHEVEISGSNYQETVKTFAEHMAEALDLIDDAFPGGFISDDLVHRRRLARARVNRLQGGKVIGAIDPPGSVNAAYLLDTRHAAPDLPAGARVLELFVLDGPGYNGTPGVDDFLLANGFTGLPVYGMLNLNTAPAEVLRSVPHGYRLLMEQYPAGTLLADSPRVLLPEAIVQYREGHSGDTSLVYGYRNGPDYSDRRNLRGGFFAEWLDDFTAPGGSSSTLLNPRGDRGMASIGELMLVDKRAEGVTVDWDGLPMDFNQWKITFAANDNAPDIFDANRPFNIGYRGTIQLSTDVHLMDTTGNGLPNEFDYVAGDAEEANLLFAGVGNMVTTRSDTFTVYLRIRSFRQNPVTGVWDATDPEHIIDDARYVMLVDRSTVNSPTDEPKVLFMEKLAN